MSIVLGGMIYVSADKEPPKKKENLLDTLPSVSVHDASGTVTIYGNTWDSIPVQIGQKDMADPVSWAYIAVVGGSLLSGGFHSKEECYGHRDVMREDSKIEGQCIDINKDKNVSWGSSTSVIGSISNGGSVPYTTSTVCGWFSNGSGSTMTYQCR